MSGEEAFSNEIFFCVRPCDVVAHRISQRMLRPALKENCRRCCNLVQDSIVKAMFCRLVANSV
eukprot:6562532-Ditylum_brightwellii.AAC.1